jgi:hypothetical protein
LSSSSEQCKPSPGISKTLYVNVTKVMNYEWPFILHVLKLFQLRVVFCFRHGNKNDSPGPGPGQYNVTGLSAKGKTDLVYSLFLVPKAYLTSCVIFGLL